MKILQLNFERGWRGGERQTLLCMDRMRAQGHEVALLARKDEALAMRAREDGFTVHEFSGVAGVSNYLLRHGRSFDIKHAQTANMVTWLAALKPWLGGGLVFTRRTAFPVSARRESRTRWKWRRVDALVAISEAAAAEPRRLEIPTALIRSAIKARPFDEAHAQRFAREFTLQGQRVLATAAALTREKDPFTLLRAVARLKQERDDFVFLHLGADGDAKEESLALHKELGLGDHYVFAGFQSDVENLYRLMDVFVLSSREEALGSSVLDAFLYAVPVVASDAGGLPELLADGRGLLCPVGDDAALAVAMNRLLDDRSLRAAITERASAYVVREHDPVAMASRYLALYQEVLDRK
ncbi:glycosyltransferase family 4 protein [Pusillimonas sp. ANT_WB101]|uniref:glycosyltransferase family 4 protein n=1 Tax=Pusillimonas sp. ANT_WB101 TaxID=2597356 RepID=UPI0011EC1F56|nr:glycosyltransferase family 4 protein [Pusillimonas sp. ANT_WB101]KAA0890779.1 glycosyltransferase family 4 protein [Pusillimonas sp. ANT_WB101]